MDLSFIDDAFRDMDDEILAKEEQVGQSAVEYAKDNGDYKDHTGLLRSSNDYECDLSGLTIKNETPYASYVESKGYDVISGAALEAERMMNE
jgi:hypothetical protein